MKPRVTFMVFMLFIICGTLDAQNTDSLLVKNNYSIETKIPANADSIEFYKSYFDNSDILVRSYNYELMNKKKRLKMWGTDTIILGSVAMLGILGVATWLGVQNNWSMWILIPVETAVSIGTVWGFTTLGMNLQKKANAIIVADIPVYSWKGNRFCASHFTSSFNRKYQGVGLSYKYTF